jgi:hypothetical protein
LTGNRPRAVALALLVLAGATAGVGALGVMGIDVFHPASGYIQDIYYVVGRGRLLLEAMTIVIGNLAVALWLVWKPKPWAGLAKAAVWMVLAANALMLAAILLPSLYTALFVGARLDDIDELVAAEMARQWGVLIALGLIVLGWVAWLAAWAAGKARAAE